MPSVWRQDLQQHRSQTMQLTASRPYVKQQSRRQPAQAWHASRRRPGIANVYITCVRSHLDQHEFAEAHPDHEPWRRTLNHLADRVCDLHNKGWYPLEQAAEIKELHTCITEVSETSSPRDPDASSSPTPANPQAETSTGTLPAADTKGAQGGTLSPEYNASEEEPVAETGGRPQPGGAGGRYSAQGLTHHR